MPSKKPKINDDKISAIFRGKKEVEGKLFDFNKTKSLINISISRLTPNPNQPRKTFYEETITELAESIREQGLLSPIIVRPDGNKYQIIAGERRYKAAQQAGLKEVPALIKKVSDGEARIISLIENIQREDLNDIDRASALRELKVNLGSPWEAIAKKLGLTKRRVLDLVGLLDLPEEVKDDIRQKKLTEKHGRALRQLLDQAEVLREVVSFVKDKKLTGDQSLELVRKIKSEPGFTIEESYEKHKEGISKKERIIRKPTDLLILEAEKFKKILGNIAFEELPEEDRKTFYNILSNTQKLIRSLIKKLKS